MFGNIVEGLDVVDKIQQVATDKNDRPLEDVRILKATVVGEEKKPTAKSPSTQRKPSARRARK